MHHEPERNETQEKGHFPRQLVGHAAALCAAGNQRDCLGAVLYFWQKPLQAHLCRRGADSDGRIRGAVLPGVLLLWRPDRGLDQNPERAIRAQKNPVPKTERGFFFGENRISWTAPGRFPRGRLPHCGWPSGR